MVRDRKGERLKVWTVEIAEVEFAVVEMASDEMC